MLNKSHQWLIDRRISCPDGGYPDSEARFLCVEDYVDYLEAERDFLREDIRRELDAHTITILTVYKLRALLVRWRSGERNCRPLTDSTLEQNTDAALKEGK